jgi:hypothetical protein
MMGSSGEFLYVNQNKVRLGRPASGRLLQKPPLSRQIAKINEGSRSREFMTQNRLAMMNHDANSSDGSLPKTNYTGKPIADVYRTYRGESLLLISEPSESKKLSKKQTYTSNVRL